VTSWYLHSGCGKFSGSFLSSKYGILASIDFTASSAVAWLNSVTQLHPVNMASLHLVTSLHQAQWLG